MVVPPRALYPGHPGRACLQSGWIDVSQVQQWRDTIAAVEAGPADVAAAYREAHPGIDWDTHVVGLRKTVHGYEAAGHRPVRTATATPGDRG